MSTTKPRITVTLEPHAHEVLRRLSAASGESMSQVVAGFVDLAVPSLERVVVVLERAKAAPEEVRSGLSAALERADRQLRPVLTSALDQTDLFLSDAMQATVPRPADPASPARSAGGTFPLPPAKVQAYADRNGAPPDRRLTPVPVTRGSGGGKTLVRVPSKGGRRGAL